MKKITWSVAALLIAGMSYGQTYNSENNKIDKEIAESLKSLEFQIEDIVDAIQMDMHYGYITQERAKYYINQVHQIKHRHQNLVLDLYKNRKLVDNEYADYCANCDEID